MLKKRNIQHMAIAEQMHCKSCRVCENVERGALKVPLPKFAMICEE